LSQHSKEGGCQCGAVRFRTTDQPIRAIGCHCGTCKQRTGAGYGVGVYFLDEDVEFLHGEMRTFEFHSSATGRWLRNHFCIHCGSTICWTLEKRPGIRGMAGGNYDDPDWFTIGAHIWTGVARSDMCYTDSVELHEGAATAE
jgi:hypothetical protein